MTFEEEEQIRRSIFKKHDKESFGYIGFAHYLALCGGIPILAGFIFNSRILAYILLFILCSPMIYFQIRDFLD